MKVVTRHICMLSVYLAGILCSSQAQGMGPVSDRTDSEAGKRESIDGVLVSWGDIDTRYPKTAVPVHSVTDEVSLTGWRGERVFAQAVVWTSVPVGALNYEITALEGPGRHCIAAEDIRAGFVRHVIGDGFFSNGTGCGDWEDEPFRDSVLVADCIDHHLEEMRLEPMHTQGIWLTCRIPGNVAPGIYEGHLIVRDGRRLIKKLNISIEARNEILPEPSMWHFHLDLWQNPYAVARYCQTELWSDAHMDAMRPLMTMLAEAGQKVITTTLTHMPWDGQTQDHFESMVTWIRKPDGTWEYGFDIFDKWVEFMMDCGITEQINCYSVAPWNPLIRYYDQASDSFRYIEAEAGTQEYERIWSDMLPVFAAHLKEKGWFERSTIAMDERPLEVMQDVIRIIREVEPDFKISFAGNYHAEIEPEIYDYCLAYSHEFPEDVIMRRRAEGKISTYYTCCAEQTPNLFTISDPSDGLFIGLEMMRRKSDGYLRWAYNSWPLDPLVDSRFRSFTSGDTFLVYPGARSSVRFERLIQGIQEYEKINCLKDRKQ